MADVDLTVQEVPTNGGSLSSLTKTSLNSADTYFFTNTGREVIWLAAEFGAGVTLTVNVPEDKYGRTNDSKTGTVTTGNHTVSNVFDPEVYNIKTGANKGKVSFTASASTGKVYIVKLDK